LVQIDYDGPDRPGGWSTLVRLAGVEATSLTRENIDSGYSPTGAPLDQTGTSADDVLTAVPDGGTIHAGGGNDTLRGSGSADRLYGEDGDDVLTGNGGGDALYGGAGNDRLTVVDGTGDGGDGDDTFLGVTASGLRPVLTGGSGHDLYILSGIPASGSTTPVTVTDFVAGDGGDQIDLTAILPALQGYTSNANPFSTHHLQLRAVGADTVLELDRDGTGSAAGWAQFLLLKNVAPSAITTANFVQSFADPHATGSGTHSPVANSEILDVNATTTTIAYTLLLGNDTDADAGDVLHVQSVSSRTTGVTVTMTPSGIVWSPGHTFDSLAAGSETWAYLSYTIADPSGAVSTVQDSIRVHGINDAPIAVDDEITVTSGSTWSYHTGQGSQLLLRNDYDIDGPEPLKIAAVGTASAGQATFDSTYGIVTYFANGGAGEAAFTYTVADDNGAVSTATVRVHVIAAAPATTITGTAARDTLQGTAGDDTILGAADNDTILATGGHDVVHGDAGNDSITIGAGAHSVYGEDGNDNFVLNSDGLGDTIDGGAGIDTLTLSASAYIDLASLPPVGWSFTDITVRNVENVNVSVWTATATIYGDGNANTLSGNSQNDKLYGRGGIDTLAGAGGNDIIDGGAGADKLTGGSGADQFVFHKGEAAGDTITDFLSGTDKIQLLDYGSGATWSFASGVLTVKAGTLTETIALTGVASLASSDVMFG
jgi:Ca2+-binding RTX toxin-like protein